MPSTFQTKFRAGTEPTQYTVAHGGQPAQAGRQDAPQPVVLPGGALANIAQSPDVQIFERLWSCEPNEAWFSPERSPNNPTRAEIGAYVVPTDNVLLVTQYNFQAYHPSGLVAHGSAPLEEKELRGQIGYLFLVKGKVPGVVQFEIEPIPSVYERMQFRPPQGRQRKLSEVLPGDYARKRANTYGSAAGAGTTLIPPRGGRHGDPAIPGIFVVNNNEQVNMSVVIYRPIGIPLSFIEATITGYLGPRTVIDRLLATLHT